MGVSNVTYTVSVQPCHRVDCFGPAYPPKAVGPEQLPQLPQPPATFLPEGPKGRGGDAVYPKVVPSNRHGRFVNVYDVAGRHLKRAEIPPGGSEVRLEVSTGVVFVRVDGYATRRAVVLR